MKVACLTGGGDCPGLNAVIRGLVRTIHNAGGETIGLLEGWRGAIEGNFVQLNPMETDEILPMGGTILGSSRTNPYKDESLVEQVVKTFNELELDCLVAIGGDDTLGVASKLYSDHNLPTIGCPKTIDNDLSSTDFTFGFDTCLNTVMDAVDKLRTTAESHRRVIVVEVMGRHAGWITCFSGIACSADAIMVPEQEVDLNAVCELLKKRRENGKKYGIVMVSEGAVLKGEDLTTKDAELDEFGHVKLGGVGSRVAKMIEKKTGIETRDVTLGHLQRGGSPSAYDRVLGTRLGIHAGRLALNKDFGKMVALNGLHIVGVPLAEAVGTMRTLYPEFLDEASEFLR
ncbi:6-phosphofructokinase 1 [Thalassoglobus neptunius]|uniref:Pyrophosphate--fructose 6-phosphate 1-phosphotransferase n=1 Tax=Thalassoglobus neptunius TaxID=1938619 RepID=A0A5C5WMW0_9PLAN|nr:ATP-dependent 6-phosphofructokinase [Thalassoglobus neptunius]TWT51950.1 6-phosphofructokinase 1 [Thalassoglobus neptunius]